MEWWRSLAVLTLAMTLPVPHILASGWFFSCWSNLFVWQALHCKLWLRWWLLWGLLRGGHERGVHMNSSVGMSHSLLSLKCFSCFCSSMSFASLFSFVIQALVSGGPLSVSFMVYDDFMTYKSGVYHHISLLSGPFQPLEVKFKSMFNVHPSCS